MESDCERAFAKEWDDENTRSNEMQQKMCEPVHSATVNGGEGEEGRFCRAHRCCTTTRIAKVSLR